VCEGEKTEPNYFNDIRRECRLSTANVQVLQCVTGTQPLQVVEYAEQLFRFGDLAKDVPAKAFDRVFAVFDRDDHDTYHNALAKADVLDNRIKNDLNSAIPFRAIASVPCFELWLLLHFEDVTAPIHRNDVYRRLKTHIPDYTKGERGHWEITRGYLDAAIARAQARIRMTTAYDGTEPYTAVHELVSLLTHLKDVR